MDPQNIETPEGLIEETADDHRIHLSSLSLLAKTIASIRGMILPLIVLGYTIGDKVSLPILLLIYAAIIILSTFMSYLVWRKFTYQICTEEIRIESGILSRNARSIPYERIQDVSIEQNLISRLLGIAAVKFETGGGKGDEGSLEYVTMNEAENLRQLIRARKLGVAETAAQDSKDVLTDITQSDEASVTPDTEDEIIFAMGIRRVFTLGIFNFSLVIFALIAGAVQQFDFLLPGDIGDLVDYFIDSFDETSSSIKSVALTTQIFAILSLIIGVAIIGMLSGQLQTFLREYGFTLTETDRGIRRRRGLVTLTDVVMPLHRVQAAKIQTGAIRKRFGWHALKFTSLGSDTGKESSHMMAPLAKDEEYWPIALRADIYPPSDETRFTHSHISYMTASLIFGLFIAAISLSGVIIAPEITALKWLWVIAIIPIMFGILSWRYHSHAMDENQIYVRSGFWNQKMTILPMIKTQSVDLAQDPLSQYLKVADVKFGIAGGSGLSTLTIHNVPLAKARHIRSQCIETAKTMDFSALIKAPKG